MFYELAAPNWGPEEYAAIERVVRSGQFTMADEVRRFEERFAEFHGCRHAVMVNSGSSANLLAVAALFYKKLNPLRAGDERGGSAPPPGAPLSPAPTQRPAR